MQPIVTAIYSLPLTALFLVLSARVILYRRAERISVGDKDDRGMIKRMRTHANFVEYAGFGLVMLLLAELMGAPLFALHLSGLALLFGRCAHAYGFGRTPQMPRLRVVGMVSTFTSILLSAGLVALAVVL